MVDEILQLLSALYSWVMLGDTCRVNLHSSTSSSESGTKARFRTSGRSPRRFIVRSSLASAAFLRVAMASRSCINAQVRSGKVLLRHSVCVCADPMLFTG